MGKVIGETIKGTNDHTDSVSNKILTRIKITPCKLAPRFLSEQGAAQAGQGISAIASAFGAGTAGQSALNGLGTASQGIANFFLNLFQLIYPVPSWKDFREILRQNAPSNVINKALEYIASDELTVDAVIDGAISEVFSNQYGPSFIEQFMGSLQNNSIANMMKEANALGITDRAGDIFDSLTSGMQSAIQNSGNEDAQAAMGRIKKTVSGFKSAFNKAGGDTAVNALMNVFGNHIDYPQVWKGSSFQSNVGITVRLYNPFPANDDSYAKYILAPLAVLMTLGTPINNKAQDGVKAVMYNTPFYCTLNCPGLFYNPFGSIESSTIIKGGEIGSISLINRPVVVDVKLNFKWMHSVLVSAKGGNEHTVKAYLNNLAEKKESDVSDGLQTVADASNATATTTEPDTTPVSRVSATAAAAAAAMTGAVNSTWSIQIADSLTPTSKTINANTIV